MSAARAGGLSGYREQIWRVREDDARQTEVTTKAQVRWIGPTAKDGWHAMGLQYESFDRQHEAELYWHYREFLEKIGS